MGLMTQSQIESAKPKWVSIDQSSGNFIYKKELFPAIDGKLLGFGSHDFKYQGDEQTKLDIYLQDGADVYDVQFGMYTWLTYRLLNFIMSVEPVFNGNDRLTLNCKKVDRNFNLFVMFNGTACKQKLNWEAAGMKKLEGDKTAQSDRRDKMIDKWVEMLLEKKKYVASAINEPTTDDEIEAELGIGDDVPF